MSTILPQNDSGWNIAQNSDKFGDVIRTRALDYKKTGYARLARKPIGLRTTTDDANFGIPLSITNDNVGYQIVTTTGVFRLDPNTLAITQTSVIDQPVLGFNSDSCIFNGKLIVTGQTNANALDTSTGLWDHPVEITGLQSNYPHPCETFVTLAFFCIGNGHEVFMYNTSYALVATLTIEAGYIVTGIRHVPGFVYIATRNIAGGNARMFVWAGTYDGSGNGTGAVSYDAEGDWIYSMTPYDSSIAIINSRGQLMRFSGNGFTQLDALPVYYSDYSWVSSAALFNLVGKVASRGLVADGKRLLMNIDGSVGLPNNQYPGKIMENQPSGVWAYEPGIGLAHRSGYVHDTHKQLTVSGVDSSYFSFTTTHELQTGDPVVFVAPSITGVNAGQTYFAIPGTTLTTRLAISPYDAMQGNYIVCSGTPGVNDIMHCDTYTSVGSTTIENPGAIHNFSNLLPNVFFGSEFFFGGQVINGAGTAVSVLMSQGMGRNVGSFTTSRIPATSLTDVFNQIFAKLKPLVYSSDYIHIKYRIERRFGVPMSTSGLVSWTSPTTFSMDTQTRDFAAVMVGDEIEITEGAGAGYTAHITSIVQGALPSTTYAVTIDTAIPTVVNGQQFDFTVNDWTSLATFTKDSVNLPSGFLSDTIGGGAAIGEGTGVFLKVEIGGHQVEVSQVIVPTSPNLDYS